MKKHQEVIDLSLELIENERENMRMMDGMYRMGTSLEWTFKNKPTWMRVEVSTDPFDALTDVADLFGAKSPKLSMTPYGPGDKNRMQAELIEQALMWHLKKTLGRKGSIQKDIVRGSFQYGRVGAQLVYLPYHEKNMKLFDGNEKRRKAAMRFGPYALINKDPRTIFPVWSDIMLEGVLNVTVQPVQKLVDFWGKDECKSLLKDVDDVTKYVTQYDYWDYEQRLVWVHTKEEPIDSRNAEKGHVLVDAENELPFLPWVVEDISDPLMPLLYPIWRTGKWDTMNIHESALVSEVIAYLAAPRSTIEGPNPGSVKQSFGTPQKSVEVPPGHRYQPLPPPPLDQNLTAMIDRLRGSVSKSTIPHTVQTADFGSGTAFASIRELIDLTTRRLNDGKAATERFFEEVFRQMLYWVDYTGDDLTAYTEDDYGEGGQIRIFAPSKWDKEIGITFDTNALEFRVTLEADIPEDQVARANAAQLSKQLGVSDERAMEMIGITNPQKEVARRHTFEVKEAHHQNTLQRIAADGQVAIQKKMMQAQAEAQQQAQQQPGQAPQLPPGAGVGGAGFNPALGGTPPAIANPQMTRETQQDRGV